MTTEHGLEYLILIRIANSREKQDSIVMNMNVLSILVDYLNVFVVLFLSLSLSFSISLLHQTDR